MYNKMENEITLLELRAKLIQLEKDVRKLLLDFQAETAVSIEEISLRKVANPVVGCDIITKVDISINVIA